MKTSATNKKIHELIVSLREKKLVPNPEFQRRLVWANKHKVAFLETVLGGFPFPEIYIAAGELNPNTGDSETLLVDGQQRITTLLQYFNGSEDIKLPKTMSLYADLSEEDKLNFLEYEVVVRDLGKKSRKEIIEIFKRINSTNYALNAMEIHHAVYDGPFMKLAESLSENEFFDKHRVFSATEVKRSKDVGFLVTLMISMLSTYFHRETEIENFLLKYNEEFELEQDFRRQFEQVLDFVNRCNLGDKSRAWQKADLLTLLVEVHRALYKNQIHLEPDLVKQHLLEFYNRVESVPEGRENNINVKEYYTAIIQGSNNRSSRINRGRIIRSVITGSGVPDDLVRDEKTLLFE